MLINKLELSAAREQALARPFALLRTLSSVTLGPTPAVVQWEELTEARFFDAEQEIRFACGQAWQQTAGGIELEEETIPLLPGFGKILMLRRSYHPDEDGQLVPDGLRLTGWKEE